MNFDRKTFSLENIRNTVLEGSRLTHGDEQVVLTIGKTMTLSRTYTNPRWESLLRPQTPLPVPTLTIWGPSSAPISTHGPNLTM